MMIRRTLLLLAILLTAAPSFAQDRGTINTISSGSGSKNTVTLTNLSERGSGVVRVRNICMCDLVLEGLVNTSTTWLTVANPPSLVDNGTYAFNAAGYSALRVRASSFTSGEATIELGVSTAGGGSSATSGGGGAGTSDTTEATQLLVESAVDGLEALIGSTNTALGTLATAAQITTIFGADTIFGTAGAEDSDVLTVQGIGGGTPIPVSGSLAVTNAGTFAVQSVEGAGALLTSSQLIDNAIGTVAAGAAATGSMLAGGIYNSGGITLTNGQGAALQVTSAGALIVSGAGGGTQYTQDVELTVATTVGTMAMGRSSAAAPTGVTADDEAVLPWYLRNGAQATVLTAGGALIGGDATNGIDVDVTRMAALVAGSADIGNVNIEIGGNAVSATNPVAVRITDGSAFVALATDATVGTAFPTAGPGSLLLYQDFDGAALATPTNVDMELEAVPQSSSIKGVAYNMLVSEDGALSAFLSHDAPDTGFLVGTGYRSIAFGANPTAVAAADRTVAYANRAGVPFTLGGHPNIITREAQIEDADGAQTNAAIVTVSAGTKIVVTQVTANCDGSTTAPTNIVVGFGAATLPARAAGGTTGILAAFDGVPAGGGKARGDGSGIIGIGADDEDVRITTEDPAGGNCSVELSYFTIES
jgi:hypothetical protein